jgi:hypothetical protein
MQGVFTSNVANKPAIVSTGVNGAQALEASSDGGTAITGIGSVGVVGGTDTGIAVAATCNGTGIGLRATSQDGWAVNAQCERGLGVFGASDFNVGVRGECQTGYNFGVVGMGANAGIAAFNPNNAHAAYLASDCCAGWFTGDVTVTGKVTKAGGGFTIDHPLDPGERYLCHSFVESSEMKNLYDGIAIADAGGEITIELPQWFEALNHQFCYHLTPIGGPAPNLHVSSEVFRNAFAIGGANPGMKVCWQVTGVRRDPWAATNSLMVEMFKQPNERGCYLHPELYGAGKEKSLGYIRHSIPEDLEQFDNRSD